MSLWWILDAIFYGLVRYILYLIPFVKAPAVEIPTPDQWWKYNSWWDWLNFIFDDGRPNEHWCRSWLEMAFGELAEYAVERARPYVDLVKDGLRSLIGYVRSGFPSLGSWVNYLQNLIGEGTLSWASNLRNAASWLYFKLPYSIRQGWQSWDQIWDTLKASVRSWAMARYDSAKSWAWDAVRWVNDTGDRLRRWRDQVAGWIEHVRGNPYGWIAGWLGGSWSWLVAFSQRARETVIGWLGPEWPRLLTFARDCVGFYYVLWSAGWLVLGDFVADPRSFVLDRLEAAVLDRW